METINFKKILCYIILIVLGFSSINLSFASKKNKISTVSRVPYLGAILIDAVTGKVLFEENADGLGYPASIVKLMDLLIILDAVKAKSIKFDDKVTANAIASKTGGSQVYLKENEVFTVDELLYALMIQSANDAAVALSIRVAGSKEAFVQMMNKKAKELDMKNTTFHSVHGLPPGKDQEPDVSTARDIAKLCLELLKYKDTLRYSAVFKRPFRPDSANPFNMQNHNHLLNEFEGCDGFKTGYFTSAGFSIASTATRKGVRAIAVVIGSVNRKTRDEKAKELLSKGLLELAKISATTTVGIDAKTASPAPSVVVKNEKKEDVAISDDLICISKKKLKIYLGIFIGFIIIIFIYKLSRRDKYNY